MSSFILHTSALIPTPRVRTLHTSSVALLRFYVHLRARLKCTCAASSPTIVSREENQFDSFKDRLLRIYS